MLKKRNYLRTFQCQDYCAYLRFVLRRNRTVKARTIWLNVERGSSQYYKQSNRRKLYGRKGKATQGRKVASGISDIRALQTRPQAMGQTGKSVCSKQSQVWKNALCVTCERTQHEDAQNPCHLPTMFSFSRGWNDRATRCLLMRAFPTRITFNNNQARWSGSSRTVQPSAHLLLGIAPWGLLGVHETICANRKFVTFRTWPSIRNARKAAQASDWRFVTTGNRAANVQ